MELTDVLERQDAFINDVIEEYGDQTFFVSMGDIDMILSDLHHRAAHYELRQSIPPAMEDITGSSRYDGDVDVVVRWLPSESRFAVGVFTIFQDYQ